LTFTESPRKGLCLSFSFLPLSFGLEGEGDTGGEVDKQLIIEASIAKRYTAFI